MTSFSAGHGASASGRKSRRPRPRLGSADHKMTLVMESAERLIAERGLLKTTIASISSDSGVHEASIYQYFKTKENLLVSIPEKRLSDALASITEHWQGMKGAEPKLRKLIWHQLRDFAANRRHASVMLRELRTLPAFYRSSSYDLILRYRAFAVDAIREGVADGEVRPDIDPAIVLDIIFGTVDSVALRWLFSGESYDPGAVADELCSLVKAAIWRRPEERSYENQDGLTRGEWRRRSIIASASESFGKRGYTAATISEVAKKAGIAGGSLYQHFRSKEELLLEIPGNWFEDMGDELQRSFSGRLNPTERLRLILRRLSLDFQTRYWEARVLVLELYRNPEFYKSQAYQGVYGFWRLVRNTVEEGMATGAFRTDFDIDLFLSLVQGAFEHEALNRIMFPGRRASLGTTEQMIHLLLSAVEAQ